HQIASAVQRPRLCRGCRCGEEPEGQGDSEDSHWAEKARCHVRNLAASAHASLDLSQRSRKKIEIERESGQHPNGEAALFGGDRRGLQRPLKRGPVDQAVVLEVLILK